MEGAGRASCHWPGEAMLREPSLEALTQPASHVSAVSRPALFTP